MILKHYKAYNKFGRRYEEMWDGNKFRKQVLRFNFTENMKLMVKEGTIQIELQGTAEVEMWRGRKRLNLTDNVKTEETEEKRHTEKA